MSENLNATDPRPNDGQNNLLAKILRRLRNLAEEFAGVTIVVQPSDIEIGAVEIKDTHTNTRAHVSESAPAANEAGLVVRNIPSGTQNVSFNGVAQPVSGTVTTTPSGIQRSTIEDPNTADKAHVTSDGALLVANLPLDFHISSTNTMDGKVAHVYHVIGRRAGFNSTTVLQDVGEFVTGNAFPVQLTGIEALEVVSSSINDDVAGSGARKVKIFYIDALGNHVTSAAIDLDGTNAVATGITALEILWMEVVEVGTADGVAAGNIQLRKTVGGTVYEQITAGGNRSLSCRFMVPAGHTGYISQWDASAVGSATQDVRIRATCESADRVLTNSWIFQDNTFLAAGSQSSAELPYLKVPSLGRIKASTISSATAGQNRVDVGFTIYCIED